MTDQPRTETSLPNPARKTDPADAGAPAHDARLKKVRFRAWHRGTREADLMIGGLFDAYAQLWTPQNLDAFEALLEEDDVAIMAWAIGKADPPARHTGPVMDQLRKLDSIARAEGL